MTIERIAGYRESVLSDRRRLATASILLAYIATFLIATSLLAERRLLWHDELFTLDIATLPNVSDVWSALLTGFEQTPPLYYAIVRFSLAAFGVDSLALRLPAMAGCLVASFALYRLVAARFPPVYGLLAALFPMITSANYYAQEARPYGLVLGFAALALSFWQGATGNGRSIGALIGMTLSLAGAVACHYYGVLLLFPLALGEAVRTARRRRIDFRVWGGLAVSLAPLLFALPLIESGRKLSGSFWATPHWADAPQFYVELLKWAAPPVVAAFALASIGMRSRASARGEAARRTDAALPIHELAAVLGFVLLPVAGLVLAKLATGAFTDRYVLPAVIGIAILFAQAMHKMLGGRFGVVALVALIFLGWFAAMESQRFLAAEQEQRSFEAGVALLRSAETGNLPIVAAEPHTFLQMSHYAPPDITARLVYLADSEAAGRLLGFTSIENGMVKLVGPWFHTEVVGFEPFVGSNRRFLVYGNLSFLTWVDRALQERNFRLDVMARPNGKFLFMASSP